jgi:hypothetical protein
MRTYVGRIIALFTILRIVAGVPAGAGGIITEPGHDHAEHSRPIGGSK